MKSLTEIKDILSKHKSILKEKYGVVKIGIFGSYARNEQVKTSDIDILVELEHPLGLKFVELAYYLEEILGEKVEITTPLALKRKPLLWKSIQEDCIYV